jgi:hypothetical protein
LKEAAIQFQPLLNGLVRLGKGVGNQFGRAKRFVGKFDEALPETPLKPENPHLPGSVKPFNTLADEINNSQFNASGTQTHGLYAGISGKPLTSALLRGLGGFTFGNSMNPYMDKLSWDERQKIGWTDPKYWAAPVLSAAVAAGMKPSVATKLLSKFLNKPIDQRIVSNIISQPIVRLGATAALGDVAESINSHVGFPALDGWLKAYLMTLGGTAGLRPLWQLAKYKNRFARKGMDQFRNLTKLVNHSRFTGANAAKQQKARWPLVSAIGLNLGVIPFAKGYTDNIERVIHHTVDKYKKNHEDTPDSDKTKFRYWFTPRGQRRLEVLDRINKMLGTGDPAD